MKGDKMYLKPKALINYPGFFEIPDFRNYGISLDSLVIDTDTGELVDAFITSSGYLSVQLLDKDNKRRLRGIHRLKIIVFKNDGRDISKMVINHIDANKLNNELDNLEVLTQQENIEHAGRLGISSKCRLLEVRDIDTLEITTYPSYIKCAKAIGISKDMVAFRAANGPERIYPERKQYRVIGCDIEWGDVTTADKQLDEYGVNAPVLVKYVISGSIDEYSSLTTASQALNVPMSTLSIWLNTPDQPVLPGMFQIKKKYDGSPWRLIGDPVLELAQFTKDVPVVRVHSITNIREVFNSGTDAARKSGIKTTTLYYRLKSKGNVVFSDGYRYMYYHDCI